MSISELFQPGNPYHLHCEELDAGTLNVGTLGVTNLAVSGTLGVAGASTLAAVTASGAALLSGGCTTTGFHATGSITDDGGLSVAGPANLNGGVGILGGLQASSINDTGDLTVGGLAKITVAPATDDTETTVLARDSATGFLRQKALTELQTVPTFVWINGGNPQPAAVAMTSVRCGSYAMCYLIINSLQLFFPSGGPLTATFTLPFARSANFTGANDELFGAVSTDPPGPDVSRLRVQSRTGTQLGMILIDNTAATTVTLQCSFVYGGLA